MNKEGMYEWMETAPLVELIMRWRYEPAGSVWFAGDVGKRYGATFARRRCDSSPEEWTAASRDADRLMIRRAQTECWECRHRREVPGNAHIQCMRPDSKMTGNRHGIDHGWFFYPLLFDPVWKTRLCANQAAGDEEGVPDAPK